MHNRYLTQHLRMNSVIGGKPDKCPDPNTKSWESSGYGQMNDGGLKFSGSSATIGASTEQRIEPEHVQM